MAWINHRNFFLFIEKFSSFQEIINISLRPFSFFPPIPPIPPPLPLKAILSLINVTNICTNYVNVSTGSPFSVA